MCDFCSRGFWHLQEFKLHRAGHTGVKPYKCGQCEIASFADVHRLNNHLKMCGKMNAFECNQCGKMYSDQKSLSTHVSDTHNKTERRCAICLNAVYMSEGGCYTHMRNKHKIGRHGRKLQDVLRQQAQPESELSEDEITDNNDQAALDTTEKKATEQKKKSEKCTKNDNSDEDNTPQSKKKRTDQQKKMTKRKRSQSFEEENTTQSNKKRLLPKMPWNQLDQVKTERNLKAHHQVKINHHDAELERKKLNQMGKLLQRWSTTVPCRNAIDWNLMMNKSISNILLNNTKLVDKMFSSDTFKHYAQSYLLTYS